MCNRQRLVHDVAGIMIIESAMSFQCHDVSHAPTSFLLPSAGRQESCSLTGSSEALNRSDKRPQTFGRRGGQVASDDPYLSCLHPLGILAPCLVTNSSLLTSRSRCFPSLPVNKQQPPPSPPPTITSTTTRPTAPPRLHLRPSSRVNDLLSLHCGLVFSFFSLCFHLIVLIKASILAIHFLTSVLSLAVLRKLFPHLPSAVTSLIEATFPLPSH